MSEITPSPESAPVLPPAPPRESLISTATKFLQSPRVQDSALDEKKQFLLKKGLTDEEINIAISRAGVPTAASSHAVQSLSSLEVAHQPQPVSTWSRIREYSVVAVVVGGVMYGLYIFYKRFIEPIFVRSSEEHQKRLECMEEGVKTIKDDLGHSMQEIRTTMQELQEKLNGQTMKLNQVSSDLDAAKVGAGYSSVSNSSIGELKAEITSIKGLLLSRNQFPSQPNLRPIIPSWQFKPNGTSSSLKKVDDAENTEDLSSASSEETGDKSGKMNGSLHGGKASEVTAIEDTSVLVNGTAENAVDDS